MPFYTTASPATISYPRARPMSEHRLALRAPEYRREIPLLLGFTFCFDFLAETVQRSFARLVDIDVFRRGLRVATRRSRRTPSKPTCGRLLDARDELLFLGNRFLERFDFSLARRLLFGQVRLALHHAGVARHENRVHLRRVVVQRVFDVGLNLSDLLVVRFDADLISRLRVFGDDFGLEPRQRLRGKFGELLVRDFFSLRLRLRGLRLPVLQELG